MGGAVVAEHVPGVGTVQHPQAHPHRGVGPDGRRDVPRWTLRGQDQVDAEATALGGHPHQGGEDLGVLAGQGRELVHHHQEAGGALLGVDVGHVLGAQRCQEPLTAVDLGRERGQGPLGGGRVQVGEHPRGVGQTLQGSEGGPTLVVHEDEGQA